MYLDHSLYWVNINTTWKISPILLEDHYVTIQNYYLGSHKQLGSTYNILQGQWHYDSQTGMLWDKISYTFGCLTQLLS